jgi:hypothetical protein
MLMNEVVSQPFADCPQAVHNGLNVLAAAPRSRSIQWICSSTLEGAEKDV